MNLQLRLVRLTRLNEKADIASLVEKYFTARQNLANER
jgi:hypothetical protein